MNFLKYLNDELMINESFDSSFEISKKENKQGIEFFYFEINSKKYRMFFEEVDLHFHIGFERYFDELNKWDINGFSNDLNNKEVLRLFGTIKKEILNLKFKSINISSNEIKKLGLYRRMLNKLCSELNKEDYNFKFGSNDNFIFIYSDIEYSKSIFKKFKYKIKD